MTAPIKHKIERLNLRTITKVQEARLGIGDLSCLGTPSPRDTAIIIVTNLTILILLLTIYIYIYLSLAPL